MITTQLDKIKELVEPLVEEKNLFLVDIEIKGSAIPEVWILLDNEETDIRIDECTSISRELALLMEAHELFANKYRLNVSSPGLSRPLSDPRQYRKNVGRQAKVKFRNESTSTVETQKGKLKKFDEGVFQLEIDPKHVLDLNVDQVIEIKIIPSFN